MATIGPLLSKLIDRVEASESPMYASAIMANAGAEGGSEPAAQRLPVVISLPPLRPRKGETWPEFRNRACEYLRPSHNLLAGGMGLPVQSILSAVALAAPAKLDQIRFLKTAPEPCHIELDPRLRPTLLDDVSADFDLPGFRVRSGGRRGAGVRVAVLDSGIDIRHPFLNVADSVETCGEEIAIPGIHGTHCAGSIASRDAVYGGIAPDVFLLNIKVLRHDGSGTQSGIGLGVDAALDRNADILSMSLGFNHLPTWSEGGHGWSCVDGTCPLCRSVDNAVSFGKIVVVAAGNEHNRAQALRNLGYGDLFDTEISCPGQARGAITVGAITKRTFQPGAFSSHGPTAFGTSKPDVCAQGVNVTSTIPVPRNADGTLVENPSRSLLFAPKNGTSMATPIVAGVVALMLEDRRNRGLPVDPAAILEALRRDAVVPLPFDASIAGSGRVRLPE